MRSAIPSNCSPARIKALACIVCALGLILAGVLLLHPQDRQIKPDTPRPSPNFQVRGLSGQVHTLASLAGSYVVLEWTNPNCNCVGQHYKGYMQRLQREFSARGVKWLLVNSAHPSRDGYLDADAARHWMAQANVRVDDYIIDQDGHLGRLFGAKSTPTVVLLSPDSRMLYFGAVDDNPEGNPAKFETATNYLLLALNDATAGRSIANSFQQAYGCPVKYQRKDIVEAVSTQTQPPPR